MSELWIYYRRPSSLVRYRHGGAAAFDPAMRSPLAKAVGHTGGADSDDDKILQFPLPPQAPRPQPSVKPRRRQRPKPAKVKPKKRDS